MKKCTLLIFLISLLSPLCSFGIETYGDEISAFLVEYKDGQKTGNYIHIHLFLYKDQYGLTQYKGTQECFVTDDNWKETMVMVDEITLEADPAGPINWIKGKLLRCKFQAIDGGEVNLIAKKSDTGNRFNWNIVADGQYRMTHAMPIQKMHYENIKEITLKYPLLKLAPIY